MAMSDRKNCSRCGQRFKPRIPSQDKCGSRNCHDGSASTILVRADFDKKGYKAVLLINNNTSQYIMNQNDKKIKCGTCNSEIFVKDAEEHILTHGGL